MASCGLTESACTFGDDSLDPDVPDGPATGAPVIDEPAILGIVWRTGLRGGRVEDEPERSCTPSSASAPLPFDEDAARGTAGAVRVLCIVGGIGVGDAGEPYGR